MMRAARRACARRSHDVFIPRPARAGRHAGLTAPDATPDARPRPLPDAPQVAYVAPLARAAITVWVQRLDGTMRRQFHLRRRTDAVPDQDDRVPPVSDVRA